MPLDHNIINLTWTTRIGDCMDATFIPLYLRVYFVLYTIYFKEIIPHYFLDFKL